MGFLGYFSAPSQGQGQVEDESVVAGVTKDNVEPDRPDKRAEPVSDAPPTSPSIPGAETESSQPTPAEIPLPLSPVTSEPNEPLIQPRGRRFSFKSFSFSVSHHDEHKHTLSLVEEHQKKEKAHAALSKRLAKPMSRSDRRAQESALMVRALIVGPSKASPSLTAVTAKPQMSKLKSQLLKPKSANKVISRLRSLPTIDEEHLDAPESKGAAPIHAVCLEHTDAEEHDMHFAKLSSSPDEQASSPFGITQFATAPIDKLTEIFNEICVVDFISTPDFGLGQPGDGKGLLAGAVPTAETVINGIQQLTPQLMALGYATGQAIYPDHAGVYPPTDRMSLITYWWGLEILLPPPSIAYLNSVHSISGTVVNFLSALSMINNGVREILPFVRYIAQFIDFEFNTIKGQDKGKGVVCAATWIMPAALVPRPWDFSSPPPAPIPAPVPPTNGSEQPEAEKSQSQGVVEKPAAGDSTSVTQPNITPTPIIPVPVQPPTEERPPEKAPADLPTALPVPISISVPTTPVA